MKQSAFPDFGFTVDENEYVAGLRVLGNNCFGFCELNWFTEVGDDGVRGIGKWFKKRDCFEEGDGVVHGRIGL